MPFSWSDAASVTLAVLFPLLVTMLDRRGRLPRMFSTIVACYVIGMVVSNLRLWPIDGQLMETVAGAGMLVGLPLLLLSVDVRSSIRYARGMLFSFVLCCLSGLVCTGAVAYFLAGRMPDSYKIAGMLTGLYTGGTPNVQAIGLALEAPASYLVLLQAADVLLGGAYLLGLITFLPAVFARFYPPTSVPEGGDAGAEVVAMPAGAGGLATQAGAAITVIALSLFICRLSTGQWYHPTVLILCLTSLSLLVTLHPLSKRLGNTYPLGEYFVLIFCVALGLLADFRELAATGLDLLLFSALALSSTTLLHLLLARFFGVDRDTVILSSVAAFYGPVFVAQVAAAIRNRHLLAAGLAVSLVGFGIGNYLGIGVAYLLRWFTS
jgi:uncharacterized membrane protein